MGELKGLRRDLCEDLNIVSAHLGADHKIPDSPDSLSWLFRLTIWGHVVDGDYKPACQRNTNLGLFKFPRKNLANVTGVMIVNSVTYF